MPGLWATLGYDEVASEVAHALSKSARIVVLEGPPGVGKSWLARGIGRLWSSAGGSTIVTQGDVANSDLSFYPFGYPMASLSKGPAAEPSLGDVAKAGEVLLGTAGMITTTVQAIAKIRRNRRRSGHKLFLGNPEQQILYDLERLGRKRPMLLVADNLHWWDAKSLAFLSRMRSAEVISAFPFLSEMRLLAVQTTAPHQEVANSAAHDSLLAQGQARTFRLARVQRERFESVLVALGAQEIPPPKVTETIWAFSAGHLAIARRCAARLARGETAAFLSAADDQGFLQTLLTERIHSLGAPGRQAVAILQVAAVLGLTFRRDQLTCATGKDKNETSALLRYCRDEDVLELSEEVGRFVHDLYRQYFLDLGPRDRVGIHERLGECLRALRPGDYDFRCLTAVKAERPTEAGVLAVQAALQEEREGRPWQELPARILNAAQEGGLTGVTEVFVTALDHLRNYRFDQCFDALAMLPRDLPKALRAEEDWIRAMCLMVTRSEDDRAAGRAILQGWASYEDTEPEVGMRLMLLLLYGLTHLRDKRPGRSLEGHIQTVLGDRSSFDVAAKNALYTLERCAGSLYTPDLALVKNRRAVEHYAPREDGEVLRHPVEYYRCLVNLGANLICNSRYQEAVAVCNKVEAFVADYRDGVFPRMDWARTNAILAQYRAGLIGVEQAVQLQRGISRLINVPGDPFYVDNALSVYLALAGRYDEALSILTRLDDTLTASRPNPEPSMVYLIRVNRCATRFVAGDVAGAQSEWGSLAALADRIAYVIRSILLRRHELLAEVIQEGLPLSPSAFDECLLARGPTEFGPLWDNFARGFRMPELEFWRDN